MSSGGSSATSLLIFLLPLALIAWMIFTQRRRHREVAALQDSLAVGDEVCTTSGLFGRVTALDESSATLQVAPGVNVRYDRRAIGTRVPPQAGAAAPGQGE